MIRLFALSVFLVVLTGCVSVHNDPRLRSVDLLPMYGGLDRQSVPELKKADEAFVESASSAFGGRERAAIRWVNQAFAFYQSDDLDMAMRRFNQAWLLDPKNPEVYWGFGAVLHDRGMAFGAYDMNVRAYKLGLRDGSFLADLGRVAVLRIAEAKETKELLPEERAAFIAESERYYEEAIKEGKNLAYIYGSWASARYWAGDYAGAWDKWKTAKTHGAPPNPKFLAMLGEKMPEPK